MKKMLIFFLMLSSLLVNCVSANELTDDYFDIANNYYHSNNFAKALEYLDLIITIEPDNKSALALKNKILPPPLDKTKEENATVQVLTNAVAQPEKVTIIEAPQVNLNKVIYDSDYYNSKGQEFYSKKDFDSACQYFTKAIIMNKHNYKAYNNLAMTYLCKDNFYEAVKYFKLANRINKKYSQPLVNLSNLYKQTGDSKKQFFYLQKALKVNNNDFLAYFYLGNYYKNLNNYPLAIANYKKSVEINQKFPQVYLSLAVSFFETEEFNYSILALKQYLEFMPNSDYAYFLLAKASLANCQYDDALTYIQSALNISDNIQYKFLQGKIYYAMEDYNKALDLFQIVLQSGDNAEAFNYLALCDYKLKNTNFAIINFNKAIELDGLRPIYYYNLAQCYKSLGDKKNYVKYVNTATKINPINYQDYIDLSCIYTDNSNPRYAISSLEDAIKRYPNEKALYLAKLKIYEAIGDDLNYNKTIDTIKMRFENNETQKNKK